ncbi:thiol-disulfide isomerase [Candidatus Bathyarchaeota archaeon]|nr:thiol-disulfide isomerase [Candidatus Bathyarchaeota archaeon]
MPKKDPADVTAEFEKALKDENQERYILRLYVTGMTPKSLRAIDNVKKICNEHLKGRCELEVIDIYQQPDYAKTEQLIAAPTLIKKLPLPLRKFIGDMSNEDRILVGLDIVPKKESERVSRKINDN